MPSASRRDFTICSGLYFCFIGVSFLRIQTYSNGYPLTLTGTFSRGRVSGTWHAIQRRIDKGRVFHADFHEMDRRPLSSRRRVV